MIKIKKGRTTITSRVAYIAGFFDGEGCIRIKKASQKGDSYYIWVAITNSNNEILEDVKELFGGQVRKAERTVNKDIYHYLITASEAVDMLKVLLSFLIEKKEQAELAIEYHNNKGTWSKDRRKSTYLKMRELKKI